MAKLILASQINAQPFNQFMFGDNSYKYRIILSWFMTLLKQ